jgi:hypothetical protein
MKRDEVKLRSVAASMWRVSPKAVSFVLALTGCDQPEPTCSVARGAFAAKYTLIEGEGDCTGLTGELLGVQAYASRTSKSDPYPDYRNASIGIEPLALNGMLGGAAGLVEPNADDKPFGLGKFSSATPEDGLCKVPSLTTSRVRLPVIPAHDVDECTTAPEQPEVDVSYVFENVKVLVSAANYGTKLEADLTYTLNGCVAKYKVAAIYPAVNCDAQVYPEAEPITYSEEDGSAICPAPVEMPEPLPTDAMCASVANLDAGLLYGSGISPDFAVRCDPTLLHCVLK